MSSKITAAVTGIFAWAPEDVMTNADLEKLVDTSDEWITTRTGIKERRIWREPGKATSDIGVECVKGLLNQTNTDPKDIELIICATATPDHLFPSTANVISDKAGLTNAAGYDISAACSGFLFALTTGAKFIEAGMYKKVVIVGADKMSSILNFKDRNTCIIFGDGGGAVLLEPNTEGYGLIDSIMKSNGEGRNYLYQTAGGSFKPASHETVDSLEHFVWQDGKTVFKFAVTNMAETTAELMDRNNLTSESVSWLVPHQANLRIIEATRERTGMPLEKTMINIHKYGNTTNGTIPLCLFEYKDRMKKGDNIVLCAFGGGFTWAAVYLKWAI
jgi:3-oxoacyl-[acyl-carrier-protein] synthase-3